VRVLPLQQQSLEPPGRMLPLQNFAPAILFALGLSATMVATTVFILFYHDRKHDELQRWVDFSFSIDGLTQALSYYRFMAASMLMYYVFFTCSCVLLQADGYWLFAEGDHAIKGGPIAIALFALDLVLRGGFFDFMQHFDLHVTGLHMNRGAPWFVWYAFVFRMFYGLTLIKILFSFVWICGKIGLAQQAHRHSAPRLAVSS
jgi:hypothetical protein